MIGEATYSATSGLMTSHEATPHTVLIVLGVLITVAIAAIAFGRYSKKPRQHDW